MIYRILSFIYLLAISTTVANMNDNADYSNINYTSNISYVIGCLNLVTVFFLLKNLSFFKKIINENKTLFLCITIFFISCFWAENKYLAIKKLSQFVGAVFALMCLIHNKKDLWKELNIYIILACLFSIFFIKFLPSGLMIYNGSLVPKGVFGHKNLLGIFSGLGALILLYLHSKTHKKSNIIFFILLTGLVLVSKSMTAVMAYFVAISFLVIISTMKKEFSFFLYGTIFLATTMLLALFPFNIFEYILSLTGKDPTFTGRSLIWIELIKIGLKNPILGSGYGSFFRADETQWLSNIFGWTASHSHNSFLQIFLETGFLGLLVSSFFIFDLAKRIIIKKDIFLLSFLPFLVIAGFFEPLLFNKNFASIFVIALYFSTSEQQ